jgi:hypothetical protein
MERRRLLSRGGAILATCTVAGYFGCGGSTTPHADRSDPIPGAPGAGGAGGGPPTAPGASGSDPAPAPGSTLFAENYGDEGEQFVGGIATDAKGNIYVAGNEMPVNIAQPSTFTGPLPMQGTANGVFLLQYSSSGELMWRQPFSVSGDNALEFDDVAVQPTTGAEIVVGTLRGSATIGGQTLTSSNDPRFGNPVADLWLTAIDSAGYLVWTVLIPSPAMVFPKRVFVAANGDVLVVGSVVDNGSVGGAPLCCGTFAGPSFAARFSPTGTPIWSTPITGDFDAFGSGSDPDGGLVIGGAVSGSAAVDGQTFTSAGTVPGSGVPDNGVVIRLDPQGHPSWIRSFPGATQGFSFVGATLDPSRNAIVYGQFEGTVDFGNGHTLTGSANFEAFDGLLAKLSPDGTTVWVDQLAGGFDQSFSMSAATDAAGNIALAAGVPTGGVDLGGAPPLPLGTSGHFVARFDPAGQLAWSRGFATQLGEGGPVVSALSFAPAGLAFSSDFDNTVDFGTGPLTAPGQPVRRGSGPELVADNVFTLLLAP